MSPHHLHGFSGAAHHAVPRSGSPPSSLRRPKPATDRHRRHAPIHLIALFFFILTLSFAEVVAGSQAGYASEPTVSQAPTNWVSPVPAMDVVEAFDPPEEAWLKGHRGIDVMAVAGEPLRAPASGSIRFRGSVAGAETLSIETDDGFVVSFQDASSELDKGARFAAGDRIGEVDSGSHCDRPCLHIGVWPANSDRAYVDPTPFFGHESSHLLPLSRKPQEERTGDETSSGAGAWGGHRNGRIPASAMCPLKTAPGHMLRCDAQAAFDRMSHAYELNFGIPISVTDSYRDYDTQVVLKRRKGRMAATPGTSNHGWALAVDLGGGINGFGSPQHRWMRANAPQFGWIHPGWARQNGSLPEAWHWEFRK